MRSMTRRSGTGGFTLLEVLLATAIMAVGTTSVLVVMATAAGMASQRQVNLRREQVIDEARHYAQTCVDAFNPAKAAGAAAPAPKKGGKSDAAAIAYAPAKVEGKKSDRYDGFNYDLTFDPRDRAVPEKGYDVTIVVHYGGGELSATATTTLMQTLVPMEEFETSVTWEEERKGQANTNKPRESR
jgi:prepilin-type N-terminal cleavage/methylation domain-containing protein